MDVHDIPQAYHMATHRLLLLDYDGTLAPIMPLPEQAVPSERILKLLSSFASDPKTTCVVISGRASTDLEKWLGGLPLEFIAEHGLMWRTKDGAWSPHSKTTTAWKNDVRLLMEKYVNLLPGSLIEEKTASLAYHYRTATQPGREGHLHDLLHELEAYSDDKATKLQIMQGKEVYEVMPSSSSKGESASELYRREQWDFVMAMGDDVTDESMFEALSNESSVVTVKVGLGETAAKYRVETQTEAVELLSSLDSP